MSLVACIGPVTPFQLLDVRFPSCSHVVVVVPSKSVSAQTDVLVSTAAYDDGNRQGKGPSVLVLCVRRMDWQR